MKIETWMTIELRHKSGQLYGYQKFRPNSYVRALIDLLYAVFAGVTYSNGAVDTSNTTRSPSNPQPNVVAAIGVTTTGIRLGTGTNAVALADYALQTAIAEGTGSGQLTHSAVSFNAPITSGTTRQFTVMRTFTNNSGGTINVKEIGLYATANSYYFMIERTLNTFSILNTASATVTYTISVTV